MLKIEKIAIINGSPRYYISCDEKLVEGERIHSRVVDGGDGELFCSKTNVPDIYYFGCKQLEDDYDHKAGYIWSSRAGCINGQFGTQLYDDCVINGVGYWHADINLIKTLVEEYNGKKYRIEQYYNFYDKNKEEPVYRLVEVE